MALDISYNNEEKLEISISGDLDINNIEEFKEQVFNIYDRKENDVVLDIEELNYIDSTGLGAFMSLYKKITDNGHSLKIINPKKNILKLFKITELDTVFGMEE